MHRANRIINKVSVADMGSEPFEAPIFWMQMLALVVQGLIRQFEILINIRIAVPTLICQAASYVAF